MMVRTGDAFLAEYEASAIEIPPRGYVDFAFSDECDGGRGSVVSVEPWAGSSWVGSFTAADPLVRRALSGIFGTPSPTRACVVERGTAFLVDVLHPTESEAVRTDGPVLSVEQIVDEALLLLVTPWSITAVDAEGTRWATHRIAIEGIRIDEVDGGWLRGVADPDDDEPRDFAVDLRSGDVIGGTEIA